MTDILFLNATRDLYLKYEVNGTLLLATKLLQAGFDVNVLRFGEFESYRSDYPTFIREITSKILEVSPKCLSIYSLWPEFHVMLRIAREVKAKRPDTVVVFGGPQSSTTAKGIMNSLDYVDHVCTSEGEETVVPFFKAVLEGDGADLASIPGLYYRKDGNVVFNDSPVPLCDLDTLPHWDDRLLLMDRIRSERAITSEHYFMPIDAGRGCPYSCSFCCTSYFWRRIYRLKSPQRIVEDIRFFNERFGIKSFWFTHDAFTANKRLAMAVCDHILEEGLDITWRCASRADCLTEEMILKMKQAGMTQIELGVETGSRRMQKLIHKNLDLEKVKKMVELLLKNGIYVTLFFMYGFPEETEQDLNETLELIFSLIDMGVQNVGMAFCSFSPSTEMTEKHLDELVFDPDIKIMIRDQFGYDEELDTIRKNKALFPFFYHLDTPLRDTYQYLHFFVKLYLNFPGTVRELRKLYHGDNLKFYRDFYNNNLSCFEDMERAEASVMDHPLEMLLDTARDLDAPHIRQVKGLMRFSYHFRQVARSKVDTFIQETYDFNYVDFSLKRPLEQYSPGKTDIRIQKTNGKMDIQVLQIHWEE